MTRHSAAATPATPVPPKAAARPHRIEENGHVRVDDYFWLRDDARKSPEVLAYLEAENAYTEAVLAPTKPLQEKIYSELVSRLKQDEDSVPFHKNGYWYYRGFEPGKDYERLYRRKGTMEAPEEILLDLNERARGHGFYRLGHYDVTLDGTRIAWSEDTVGRNQYAIRIRDLATAELHPETIENTSGDVVWAADGRTLFYTERDPVTLLAYKVRRHRLGTDPASDPVVWEEKDRTFYTEVTRTKSDRFLLIHSHSTLTSEVRLLPADHPDGEFRVFLPRERDHEYRVEDLGDRFLVLSNWKAKNFRLLSAPAATTADRSTWSEIVGHRDDVLLDDFEAFPGYVAIAERSAGLKRVRVKPLDAPPGTPERYIETAEEDYAADLAFNSEQGGGKVRYTFTSLKTPKSTYELDLATGERRLLKVQEVLGGYSPERYETDRIFVAARDGAQVPVSLLYLKSTKLDGNSPLLVEGYGSYGISSDPIFHPDRFSLVDRGFVYAIAHVRGGEELGRSWYEEGKLLRKKNTFFDFIDVTEALVARKVGARDKIFAAGGSAGGLLMGAIVNLRPDLYRGVVAAVPFVDVVTTMLDESIPLTSNEFDEWGNPKQKLYYDYMLSYSPYDQVKPQAYPNLLVTTGLWDSQVQYFEPAKWVAKLRATKTDTNWLLLKTNMQAGHGGKSGRFERLRDVALRYAFFLELIGIRE
jgi:oligopeptidase B